jgi:hypothetical protein
MSKILSILAGVGIAVSAAGTSGCTSSGYGYHTVGFSAGYQVPAEARMVYSGNGLWVVADQPYPTFYSHGFYWLYGDGIWYRSRYHDRGWTRTYRVPPPIYRIDRPRAYVRYDVRPGMRWQTVRDHRRAYRGEWRDNRRDWRDYRHRGERRVHRQRGYY